MFERYTDRARRIVVIAQEEARMLNHNYVGTEHILLGIIHEGDGIAGQVLLARGLTLERIRDQVSELIGLGQQTPSGHLPFTPRAKKVLELALREALQMGHNFVGTEHILLGVVREGEGAGALILMGGPPPPGEQQYVAAQQGVLVEIRKAVMEKVNGLTPRAVGDVIVGGGGGGGTVSSSTVKVPALQKGRRRRGGAVVKWGVDGISVRAPFTAIDDLVILVTEIRDEIACLDEAARLLEKFGYTVTPPPAA